MLDWGVQGHHHQKPNHDPYQQQQQGCRKAYQQQQQQQGCRKGPWTLEEDKLLLEYVNSHGEGRWSTVAKCAGLNRSGKSCRLRWVNYLRPGLKRGQMTPQEEGIILELHSLWGNKWSTIARYLPGRTDNEIKNYWRTHYKKKEKSSSKQDKVKRSQSRKQQVLLKPQPQGPQPQQQSDLSDHLVSGDHMNLDNEQNITSSLYYPTTFFNDQFSLPQSVAATSSDQSMIDESQLWGNLWNLEEGGPQGFACGSGLRTGSGIGEKYPSCGSGDYSYAGFYMGG